MVMVTVPTLNVIITMILLRVIGKTMVKREEEDEKRGGKIKTCDVSCR
jgi:hypothetical protein